jgi:hypothetical protein
VIGFLPRRWFDISITVLTTGDKISEKGDDMDERKRDLEKRFDDIGWGLLFLAFAALALPSGTAEYASIAVVGAGMLGLNGVRVVAGVPVRWFSTVLGATGLVAGIMALGGVKVDAFALFFVFLGVLTIGAAVVRPARRAITA